MNTTFKCHNLGIWIPDLGQSINHTFCMNLPAPLLQEVSPVCSRDHQASHQLPKLEMTGWFPYVAAIRTASSKKEVGAITVIPCSSPQGCTLNPALLGTEKIPVCLAVEKVVGCRETLPENQRLPDIPGRGLLLLLHQRLRWHSPRIVMCLHSLAAGQSLFIFFL